MSFFNIILFGVYVLATVGGVTCVKLGAAGNKFLFQQGAVDLRLEVFTIVGIVLYLLSFVLWNVLLGKFNVNYIQPISSGVNNALTLLVSVVLLHESATLFQWSGIGLILIGVVLMNLGK